MQSAPKTEDVKLFHAARDLLSQRHHPHLHQVAAAVRTVSGSIHLGLHIGSRRVNVCAESSAIANASISGEDGVIAMVAVCRNTNGEIIVTNPCGVCRELMGTYAPNARVMIDDRGTVAMMPAEELMPFRWMYPFENDWTPNAPHSQ